MKQFVFCVVLNATTETFRYFTDKSLDTNVQLQAEYSANVYFYFVSAFQEIVNNPSFLMFHFYVWNRLKLILKEFMEKKWEFSIVGIFYSHNLFSKCS